MLRKIWAVCRMDSCSNNALPSYPSPYRWYPCPAGLQEAMTEAFVNLNAFSRFCNRHALRALRFRLGVESFVETGNHLRRELGFVFSDLVFGELHSGNLEEGTLEVGPIASGGLGKSVIWDCHRWVPLRAYSRVAVLGLRHFLRSGGEMVYIQWQ